MSNEWKMVRLGDAFILQMGKTPDRQNQSYWNNASNKWISIADITKDKYICNTKESISDIAVHESGIKAIPPNTAIMSFKLSIGKVCITKDEVYSNEAIIAFRPNKPDSIDISFLYYRLLSHNWTLGINKAVKGITLNKASLNNTRILFPISILQQREIAQILDKANELIEKRKEQLRELDRLVESVFYDIFGDPVTNSKGWEKKIWEELFHTRLGKMLDKNKQVVTDILLPYLGNSNVLWGGFVLNNLSLMTFSKKEIDILKLHKDDLLICEGGEAGRCAIWNEGESNILFQKAIHRARIKNASQICVVYVQRLLFELKAKGALNKYLSKATIEHLTGEKLNTVEISIPPLPLQRQFASIIEKIEAQKAKVKEALKESEALFQRLMQDMFNPKYHEK